MTRPLLPPPRSPSRRPTFGRTLATLAAVLCLLGPLVASPAAAQTAAGPSASTSSSTSTTTALVPDDAAPATTVPGGAGTTTTVPATTTTTAPWAATVPGPPPTPAVSATPAEIARADQLEQQIVAQSNTLDVLAGQYDTDQQKVAATTAALAQVQAQLATSQAGADAAQSQVAQADQTLRAVAVDAYVNMAPESATGPSALVATYEEGFAQVDSQTALAKALDQLQQLHRTEQDLQAAETAIGTAERQAAAANTAAQAASAQAQAAAQSATGDQEQLLSVVSQAGGTLAPLVAAAQDAEAQAAFQRFSASDNLDFAPAAALPGVVPQAAAALQAAIAQVGKPYQWGAAGPNTFDCSGLTMWAWAQAGVAIPRVAADQQSGTTPVPISQLAPGDLVFFGNPAHHVGMYLGNGLMVDAPHTGAVVTVESIWWDDLAGFGRVK